LRVNHSPEEKPLRFDRMSGLDAEQLDELEERIAELLDKPWRKEKGRRKELSLREALVVTCGYERDYNNQVSSLRAPAERAIAQLKTWRILFTDYRRPLRTFLTSFRAAIGLYFFKLSFA
jgi:hypothetical protein